MFNEILLAVTDFLRENNNPFKEKEDTTEITKYLSLGFDIPNYCILGIKTIRLSIPIGDIVLVDIDESSIPTDTGLGEVIRINDYAMYNGRVTKIISFNSNLAKKNELNMAAMVLGVFGDIINTIVEQYLTVLCNDKLRSTASFTNIIKYAAYIMSIAYMQEFYPYIGDEEIAKIYVNMNPNITAQSISSMRRLVSEFSVKSLLDECIWYGVTNREYPEVRFDDKFPDDEEIKWDEDNGDEEEERNEYVIN